jgi:hypothetical protein
MFTGPARRTYRVEPMRDPVPGRTSSSAGAADATDAVPDFLEPVVGWRTWLVVPVPCGLRLRSVVFATDWAPRQELAARCELIRARQWHRPWRRVSTHVAPATSCECGVWAAKDIEYAADFFNLYDDLLSEACVHRAIGRVALWGAVVDGGLGWRASHAYPADLYVPTHRENGQEVDARAIARGLARYGVPVEVVPGGIGGDVDGALDGIRRLSNESVGELSSK